VCRFVDSVVRTVAIRADNGEVLGIFAPQPIVGIVVYLKAVRVAAHGAFLLSA